MPPFLAPLLAVLVAVAPTTSDAQPVRTILQTPLDTIPQVGQSSPPSDTFRLPHDPPDTIATRTSPLRSDTAEPRSRNGIRPWTVRLGLHGSGSDIGLAIGAGQLHGFFAAGLDAWIRPGVFTREVRTSPGRRAQYKEVLYGTTPWLALDVPIFPSQNPEHPFRMAAVGALDVSGGTWYGTTSSPGTESVISAGLRATFPIGLQLELRRSFGEGMLGHWRGELAWEL